MTRQVKPEAYNEIFGIFMELFADMAVKPAAGTLRVVEALAIPGMLVEYEFWAAR
jgi:enamine deaminase RidA (YjgF/YER057c/UK114 family)